MTACRSLGRLGSFLGSFLCALLASGAAFAQAPLAGAITSSGARELSPGPGRYLLNDDWRVGEKTGGQAIFNCAGPLCGGSMTSVTWRYSLRAKPIKYDDFAKAYGELNRSFPGQNVEIAPVSGWRRGADTLVFRGETITRDAGGQVENVHTGWIWSRGGMFTIESRSPVDAYARSNLDIFIEKADVDIVNRHNQRRAGKR